MRVCLVSYEYPPDVGGEATYTRNLAVGLARLGHEVDLVIPDKGRPPDLGESGVKRHPVRIAPVPTLRVASFMLAAVRELRRLNLEERIDIAHITFDYPSLPLPLSGSGIPTVMTVHHLHLVEALNMLRTGHGLSVPLSTLSRGFLTTLAERAALRGAESVIAVSRFTKDSIVRHAGVASDKVTVIPNGIDMGPFLNSTDHGRLRARLGVGSRPVVLFVGRLGSSKGLEDLVRAFGKAKRRLGNTCLMIVGSGPADYSAQLKRLASAQGLRDDVVFTGRLDQDDLLEAYAASSVVVLPSLMEGFGMSLIEAMASGRPCVATRVGAIPEVVSPRSSGILVGPGDPDALSAAITDVMLNPREARSMGERGRELVRETYTVERMVGRTCAAYLELGGGGGRRTP